MTKGSMRCFGLFSLGILLAAPALAAPPHILSARLLEKVDTRLLGVLQVAPDSAVSAWVEFSDKGESGPADLAARLAQALASLTERSLTRRTRAGVFPLVDYRDLPVNPAYVDAVAALGLQPFGASRWFNRVAVRAHVEQLEALAGLGFVQHLEAVEWARVVRDPEPPAVGAPPAPEVQAAAPQSVAANPTDYGVTWNQLSQVQLPALHDSGYIGTGTVVCVLDDGFNRYRTHEALRDIPVPLGYARDFVQGDYEVQDTVTAGGSLAIHGAQTLGCAGGRAPGRYLGAAYGATFALGRTEYDATETPSEMVYWGQGAEWADSLGADIISSSLGYTTFDAPYPSYTYANMNGHSTTVTLAAIVAAQKGILVVTAAGNAGNGSWHYIVAPGDVSGDSALTVGAVWADGSIASFSSRGPTSDGRIKPDVVARGVGCAVPDPTGNPQGYTTASGTSFSTPTVAGVAACLKQAHPGWGPVQLSQALRFTADRASMPDTVYGYGTVRAFDALVYPVDVAPRPGASAMLALRGRNPFAPGSERTAVGMTAGSMLTSREARLDVLDVQGRRIRALWRGIVGPAASYRWEWDGRDDEGRTVGSGAYWLRLNAGGAVSTVAVVALR